MSLVLPNLNLQPLAQKFKQKHIDFARKEKWVEKLRSNKSLILVSIYMEIYCLTVAFEGLEHSSTAHYCLHRYADQVDY